MTRRRITSLFVAVAAAVGAGAMPATMAGAASDPIQPGDEIITTVGGCTLNFAYDGAGAQAGQVFLGTAAHCVERVGDPVETGSGESFGRVAFIGDENTTVDDYAFIEVLPAYVPRVSAAVKGNTTYPTGYTTAAETNTGDLVQLSGYGLGFGITATTQERRVALLTSDSASQHAVAGPIIFGDSGGPLVHIPTGKALGIVSRLCFGICSEEGPTIEGVLAKAAAGGFQVALRTV